MFSTSVFLLQCSAEPNGEALGIRFPFCLPLFLFCFSLVSKAADIYDITSTFPCLLKLTPDGSVLENRWLARLPFGDSGAYVSMWNSIWPPRLQSACNKRQVHSGCTTNGKYTAHVKQAASTQRM